MNYRVSNIKEHSKRFVKKSKKFLKNYNYHWKFKLTFCLPVFFLCVFLDVITKQIAFQKWGFIHGQVFIKGFIRWNPTTNYGIAYGAHIGSLAAVITIALLIVIVASLCFVFSTTKWLSLGFVIIVSGGISNIVDRIWNNGGVVDFIEIIPLGIICNLADVFVIFGCVWIVIASIAEIIKTIQKNKKAYREDLITNNKVNNVMPVDNDKEKNNY